MVAQAVATRNGRTIQKAVMISAPSVRSWSVVRARSGGGSGFMLPAPLTSPGGEARAVVGYGPADSSRVEARERHGPAAGGLLSRRPVEHVDEVAEVMQITGGERVPVDDASSRGAPATAESQREAVAARPLPELRAEGAIEGHFSPHQSAACAHRRHLPRRWSGARYRRATDTKPWTPRPGPTTSSTWCRHDA